MTIKAQLDREKSKQKQDGNLVGNSTDSAGTDMKSESARALGPSFYTGVMVVGSVLPPTVYLDLDEAHTAATLQALKTQAPVKINKKKHSSTKT